MNPGLVWGATPAERARRLPCDELEPGGLQADRAISIDAAPYLVYAWLCQLRVAPYSYDLIDNLGRRSPETRDPGLTALAAGQRFMFVFELVEFIPGQCITLRTDRVSVTYAVYPEGSGTRLVVRVRFRLPRPIAHPVAFGDLLMTRKQLLTLKKLAEAEQHGQSAETGGQSG
ncbi:MULTISPECIES: hypothetical protein [unclassified Nocardia]|uniref:hypothetical protein n=1 Tax=unclassified Nocardia TaxID=2637762 RepID=UPI001CE475EA|nr:MULTISPECIES: hypothetical protein [unclassified Nocardia]